MGGTPSLLPVSYCQSEGSTDVLVRRCSCLSEYTIPDLQLVLVLVTSATLHRKLEVSLNGLKLFCFLVIPFAALSPSCLLVVLGSCSS